jgi:hypothetical protein
MAQQQQSRQQPEYDKVAELDVREARAEIEQLRDLHKYAKQFLLDEKYVKFQSDGAWHTFHIFKDAFERCELTVGENENEHGKSCL